MLEVPEIEEQVADLMPPTLLLWPEHGTLQSWYAATGIIMKISDLRPREPNDPIDLKVYRKWINYRPPNPTPTGYCCIFIDKEGAAVQANMKFKDQMYFDGAMKLGGCYRISNYITERTMNHEKTVPSEVQLELGRATMLEEISDMDFPLHFFNFISHSQLLPRLNKHEILTDYIASLRSVDDVIISGSSTKRTSTRRQLHLENLSGDTIKCTVWDTVATEFDKKGYMELPHPVIAAVTSLKVTEWNGHLQLTGTPATHIYINPEIAEVKECFAEYNKLYNDDPPLIIQPYQPSKGEDINQEKERNRFPLATLANQNPLRYMGTRFTSKATIASVDNKRAWFYKACNKCTRKVRNVHNEFQCPDHGPTDIGPRNLYNFRAVLEDETTQVDATFFTPVADAIIGMNCDKLVNELGYDDPVQPPIPIIQLIGQTKIFQLHFTAGSKRGMPEFIVDAVWEDKAEEICEIQSNTQPGIQENDTNMTLHEQNQSTPSTVLNTHSQQKNRNQFARSSARRKLFEESDGATGTKKQKMHQQPMETSKKT